MKVLFCFVFLLFALSSSLRFVEKIRNGSYLQWKSNKSGV